MFLTPIIPFNPTQTVMKAFPIKPALIGRKKGHVGHDIYSNKIKITAVTDNSEEHDACCKHSRRL